MFLFSSSFACNCCWLVLLAGFLLLLFCFPLARLTFLYLRRIWNLVVTIELNTKDFHIEVIHSFFFVAHFFAFDFIFRYRFRVNRIVKIYIWPKSQNASHSNRWTWTNNETHQREMEENQKKKRTFGIFPSCFHSNAGIKMTVKILLALWFTIFGVFFSLSLPLAK